MVTKVEVREGLLVDELHQDGEVLEHSRMILVVAVWTKPGDSDQCWMVPTQQVIDEKGY